MMQMFIPVLFFLPSFLHLVSCANILGIVTLPSPSHHIFNDGLLLELVNRGHNVTILCHDEDKHHHPNYTYITMEGVYEALKTKYVLTSSWKYSTFENIMLLKWDYYETICLLDVETQGFKKLLNYPGGFKFDLIVWDIYNPSCLYPLVDKFGRPPVLGTNPFVYIPHTFSSVFQSHVPLFMFDYSDHMSYYERMKSNFWKTFMETSRRYYSIPKQRALAKKIFGYTELTVESFERNMSLILTNHNPIFHYVKALPPNIIPVGGIHITPPKELPSELKRIMDGAKNGVILFSLGSNIKSDSLGSEKLSCILQTFSRLPYTFVWKFESENPGAVPENVHVMKWVPQKEVLAHPNTVLFITHGGGLSSNELVHFGVPAVGIPFYLDQIQNVGILKARGVAEKINFQDIEGDKFLHVIAKVLNNSSYRANAKRLSILYRDRQNEPLETAMYWTEYLLRHGSAAHLDIATRDMDFVRFYNLDLVALLMLLIFISIALLGKCCIYVLRKKIAVGISTKKTKWS